jgi:hypothetical protein
MHVHVCMPSSNTHTHTCTHTHTRTHARTRTHTHTHTPVPLQAAPSARVSLHLQAGSSGAQSDLLQAPPPLHLLDWGRWERWQHHRHDWAAAAAVDQAAADDDDAVLSHQVCLTLLLGLPTALVSLTVSSALCSTHPFAAPSPAVGPSRAASARSAAGTQCCSCVYRGGVMWGWYVTHVVAVS